MPATSIPGTRRSWAVVPATAIATATARVRRFTCNIRRILSSIGYDREPMSQSRKDTAVWAVVVILSVISAGAYVGNEAARYFWDLTEYVEALDSDFPYRYSDPYPF